MSRAKNEYISRSAKVLNADVLLLQRCTLLILSSVSMASSLLLLYAMNSGTDRITRVREGQRERNAGVS